ncbi:TPA: hypothetical protein LVM22_001184 [Klebsiella oxytoca]|nr:hypothetical protein [Klebsiella oxytoca]
MTTFYSALPKETVIKIRRNIVGTDTVNEYELTVKEIDDKGLWSSDSGTVHVSAVIAGSRDTLNEYNKNAEIDVCLINGIPCARTGFNRDGLNRSVIEKDLWCQEDMPELRQPWEVL